MAPGPASAPSEPLIVPASPTSSQSSSDEESGHALKSKKDRRCPFCHQKFTSSSLGRHLDLFIRPKNPKAPDGVHDVSQIRRIRGGITRRTTKHSAGHGVVDAQHEQRASSTSLRSPRSPRQASGAGKGATVAAISSPVQLPSTSTPAATQLFRLQPNFSATGVINDLPPRTAWSTSSVPGSQPQSATLAHEVSSHGGPTQEGIDHAKALEMAFKEVLRTIRAATDRVHKSALYPFDPLSLSFPALCLRILQPPTTLFSVAPTPTPASWPLGLPDQFTYETVRKELSQRVYNWRHGLKFRNVSASVHADGNNGLTGAEHAIGPESQPVFDHLASTWEYWQTLSLERKYETWQLEMMRALVEAQKARDELEKARSDAQLEVDQLRVQLDTMQASQQLRPSQVGHHNYQPGVTSRDGSTSAPPQLPSTTQPTAKGFAKKAGGSNLRLTDDVAVELSRASAGPSEWDFECLLSKWKAIIQSSRGQGEAPSLFAGRATPSPSVSSFPPRHAHSSSPGAAHHDSSNGSTIPSPPLHGPITSANPNSATGGSRAPAGQLQSQAQGQGRFRTSIWINSRSGQPKQTTPYSGSTTPGRLNDVASGDSEDRNANLASDPQGAAGLNTRGRNDDSDISAPSSHALHAQSAREDGPRHMFPPYALIGEDERSAGAIEARSKPGTATALTMANASGNGTRLRRNEENVDGGDDGEAESDVSMDY